MVLAAKSHAGAMGSGLIVNALDDLDPAL